VRAALDTVGTIERRRMMLFCLDVDHASAGRVENDLRARGVTIRGATYGAVVRFELACVPGYDVEAVIAEVSGGALTAVSRGADWVDAG
jgi:hypothetical protein